MRPERLVRRLPWAALALALAAAGCDRAGPFPVEGALVWEDGSPAKELERAQVIFDQPERRTTSRGSVRADGTFRLTTYRPDDGALAGDYKVLVMEVGLRPVPGGDGSKLAPAALDLRYADPARTDLTATVKPGTNPVTLTVRRARKPRA